MKRRVFLGLAGGALSSCGEKSSDQFWKGIVFGIPVGIRFRNLTSQAAESLGQQSLELARTYEEVFSLWDESSELSRLNQQGELASPSPALVECLKIARQFYEKSGGLFDPSIHSYLEWVKAEYASGKIPDPAKATEKRKLVDFSRVEISEKKVTLSEGMSLSLNALAQGYVTDRVSKFLEERVLSALVNFGEFRVVGPKSFPVEIEGKEKTIELSRALAVSSGGGERLSATESANHLIRPQNGSSPDPKKTVVVEAGKAVEADAIATIVALGGEVPEGFGETKVWRL